MIVINPEKQIKKMDTLTTKKILIGLGIFAGLILLLWIAWKATSTSSQLSATPVNFTFDARDHEMSNPEAGIVLVEYSDYQCPACKSYEPVVKKLIADHGKDISFVYRNFPLPGHANAKDASYAAEAAHQQKAYDAMKSTLFEKQEEWSAIKDKGELKKKFVSYAKSLKLDTAQFEKDYDSDPIQKKVEDDIVSGNQALVDKTPTFFFNGQQVDNPTYNSLSELITQELKKETDKK